MNDETCHADIIVIGGGIAGVSAASQLALHASVILIEAEPQLGYHATGRSAAFFASVYGNREVRTVSSASRPFFVRPPNGFSDVPLLRPRSGMYFARRDQMDTLTGMADELGQCASLVSGEELTDAVPVLRSNYVAGGLLFEDGGDIDVNALLYGYVRSLKLRGGDIVKNAQAHSLQYERGIWSVGTTAGRFMAPVIINAAGAWADEIAALAGLNRIGLEARRRTACLVEVPETLGILEWPILVDIDENLYFKPEAGKLMVSPGDKTPTAPCDAQPDELDVAVAIDRFEKATTLDVSRVSHTWAGLRTFAPDESPIVGFDPRAKGFFWLAAQGGFGVQTAPGLAQLTANLLADQSLSGEYCGLRTLASAFDPARML